MSPIKKEADPNLVAQMCAKVNADFDGAQIALDLITPKLQSNQEWELLISLYVLEACVKNCGDRFHDLIGRFRFLNEIIKLISPKYYGNRTSEKVKKRCVELLYCWSDGLPSKTKIREAYDMLKKQGLVQTDPTYVEKLVINVPPRPKNAIFDNEEKSRQLAQLLKSKNPQDLEAANRLIKNMVRQDEIKVEKQSNRLNELELVNNNVKLLNDMLLNFNHKTSTESERETIKYLYEELQKLRPNLVKLANETDDDDESIGEIIKTNEQCERIINQYRVTVLNERGAIHHQDDKLVNININEEDAATATSADLMSSFSEYGASSSKHSTIDSTTTEAKATSGRSSSTNVKYDPLKELQDLFSTDTSASVNAAKSPRNDLSMFLTNDQLHTEFTSLTADTATKNIESLLSSISVGSGAKQLINPIDSLKKPGGQQQQAATTTTTKTPQLRALDDLNELGRNLIEKSLNDPKTPLTAAVNSSSTSSNQPNMANLTLNDLQQIKISSSASSTSQSAATLVNKNADENSTAFTSLNTLFVELESIKPGHLAPFVLYDKNNLKVVLHFGRDSPVPDVIVVVISVTSSNSQSALKNFSFQAAVPKVGEIITILRS